MVTANNTKLPITHVEAQLQDIYYVPGMKKNLLLESQLTAIGNFVVFGPDDVKVCRSMKFPDQLIMESRRQNSIYVMSPELAYVQKA
ncbi:hypothetical protein AMTR_s00056p00132650 [Amborella trichopoda]|uniref:Uncharacterized protein n=1 Tax=Amborella trichopoda TaxID=13333 RepID=U5D187_AMBTC|nr:hypothetical protein AMTR_s00056p00132650 [Amborella trichopoda]